MDRKSNRVHKFYLPQLGVETRQNVAPRRLDISEWVRWALHRGAGVGACGREEAPQGAHLSVVHGLEG
jgi:hypothetical protein